MMITGTRWLLSNGSAAPTQDLYIPPAVLYIANQFYSSDAGTYICSPNNMANNPSRDTIDLIAAREYLLIWQVHNNTHSTSVTTLKHQCSLNCVL